MKQLLRLICRIWNKARSERDARTKRFQVLEYYLEAANCDQHLNEYDKLEAKTMRAKDKLDIRYHKLAVERGIKEAAINKAIIKRQLDLCNN